MASAARVWAFLCLSGFAGASELVMATQTIHITGTAVDGVSGRPISAARVMIVGRELISDAKGRFEFDVAAGRWEIEVSAPNYTSRKVAFNAGSPSQPLVIQLIPEDAFKERLEVTAPAPCNKSMPSRSGISSFGKYALPERLRC